MLPISNWEMALAIGNSCTLATLSPIRRLEAKKAGGDGGTSLPRRPAAAFRLSFRFVRARDLDELQRKLPASVIKTSLMSCQGERLTRRSSADDVRVTDFPTRYLVGD